MGIVTSDLLTSVKLKHLSPNARWIWVAFNLLVSDSSGLLCNPLGEPYPLKELIDFVMMDEESLIQGLNELMALQMIEWKDKWVRLLWSKHEERIYRCRLMARNRKARQRQREKDGRCANA